MFAEFEKEEMLNDEDLYINAMNNDFRKKHQDS